MSHDTTPVARPRIVKADVDVGVPLEDFDERQIATCVGLLENVIEIADGLMRVDEKDQMELWRHGN